MSVLMWAGILNFKYTVGWCDVQGGRENFDIFWNIRLLVRNKTFFLALNVSRKFVSSTPHTVQNGRQKKQNMHLSQASLTFSVFPCLITSPDPSPTCFRHTEVKRKILGANSGFSCFEICESSESNALNISWIP